VRALRGRGGKGMNVSKKTMVWSLVVLAILIAGDLATKAWISSAFRLGQSRAVIPGFFNLTLVHNTGAAFGMGARWSQHFFVIVSILAVGVIGYLFFKLKPHEWLSRWGLVLILSGALGNLADRLRFGYVVDFLDVYMKTRHWPSFNVADSAITVGAILFGIDLLRGSRNR
jgi:signal peptidase II